MNESFLPQRGFVYWPVGSGDSTTICVDDRTKIQIDLRHLEAADDSDDPRVAIIDRLVPLLPIVDGMPFLSLFILTHPDKDHCQGFAELLDRVKIGEIWHTPRLFRELEKHETLCYDAIAFRKEARRRVRKTIEQYGYVASGDRVRIIGWDDLLKEEAYQGFPKECLTVPGNSITTLDGRNYSSVFCVFVHSPFKDDCDGDRNETSLGLQVVLKNSFATVNALFFGDLCYPTLMKIFEISNTSDVQWNLLLSPHHCSKSVMYWKDDPEGEEVLKDDILESLQNSQLDPGFIIASSEPIPNSNNPGDNPPHAKARDRYLEIVRDQFICTQEHPNEQSPVPVIFSLEPTGIRYVPASEIEESFQTRSLRDAVFAARGKSEPPVTRVGFGCKK